MEEMNGLLNQITELGPLALNCIKAIAILVVGYILSRLVHRWIRWAALKSETIDDTLGYFFGSLGRYLVLIVTLITVLQLFGIQVASLIAVLGAATLAIGLALQGTLSNIAAGVMLVIFRPYKLEDYVDIGGTSGTITDLTLFFTQLRTPDNVQIIMPNSTSWGAVITNYSFYSKRRLDLTFGIDYGDNADKAMEIITTVANSDDRVFDDPAIWVKVTNLGDSSVDITTRMWCTADDYWTLKFDLTKEIKEAFDKGGISIPYPHQVEIRK
jgi:small conductance mechanosensitive channel